MDLEKWKALLRAVETGSLSAAGDAMGYTPSGISRMIASLEAETGFSLLLRGRHGVEPTPECQSLLPTVRELLHLGERLKQQTAELSGAVVGAVSVGTAYSAYYPWLSKLISRFCALYPGITVNLLEGTSSKLCQAMAEHRADLCIISRRDGDFQWIPLAEDQLMALVSPNHPFVSSGVFPLTAFASEPFIDIYPGQETDNSRLFTRYGIRPNIRFTTLDSYAAHAMVEAGLGVTLANGLLARELRGSISALPLDPPQSVSIGLAFPRESAPAARRFIAFVRQNIPT